MVSDADHPKKTGPPLKGGFDATEKNPKTQKQEDEEKQKGGGSTNWIEPPTLERKDELREVHPVASTVTRIDDDAHTTHANDDDDSGCSNDFDVSDRFASRGRSKRSSVYCPECPTKNANLARKGLHTTSRLLTRFCGGRSNCFRAQVERPQKRANASVLLPPPPYRSARSHPCSLRCQCRCLLATLAQHPC